MDYEHTSPRDQIKGTKVKGRIIIFDNEGVIVPTNWDLVARLISERFAITPVSGTNLKRSLQLPGENSRNLLQEYSCGAISLEGYWSRVLHIYGLPETAQNIAMMSSALEALAGTPDQETVGLLEDLKSKGYPLLMLSNATPEIARGNQTRDRYFRHFDKCYYSFEIGYRKPEPEAFHVVLRDTGFQPAKCIFVDDKMVNVKAAIAEGMVGIEHHIGAEPLKDKLAPYL